MKKTGRNKPCHCGSGLKYKKCCLGRDTTSIPNQYRSTKMIPTRERIMTVSEYGYLEICNHCVEECIKNRILPLNDVLFWGNNCGLMINKNTKLDFMLGFAFGIENQEVNPIFDIELNREPHYSPNAWYTDGDNKPLTRFPSQLSYLDDQLGVFYTELFIKVKDKTNFGDCFIEFFELVGEELTEKDKQQLRTLWNKPNQTCSKPDCDCLITDWKGEFVGLRADRKSFSLN